MERTIVEGRRTAFIGNTDKIVGDGGHDIFGADFLPATGGAINQLIDLRSDGPPGHR